MKSATFCGYGYIAMVVTHVAWTSFTLSTGINVTVWCRAAGCSLWANHPNLYSMFQVFLAAQADLYAFAVSCVCTSRIDTKPLMKVATCPLGAFQAHFRVFHGPPPDD